MTNYNTTLQTNNSSLEEIISQLNNMPDAGQGGAQLPILTSPGTAADLLAGKELIDATGSKITGTIPKKYSSDVTSSLTTVTIPAGYYASQVQKTVTDADLIAANIKEGVNIFGVIGTYGGIKNYVPLMLQGKAALNLSLTNYNNTQAYTINTFTNKSVAGITYNYTDDVVIPVTPSLFTDAGEHYVTLNIKNLNPVLYVKVCIKVNATYTTSSSSSNASKILYVAGVIPPGGTTNLMSLNSIQHAGTVLLKTFQSTVTTEYLRWSDTTMS